MKFGMRTPSPTKSLKARTTGKLTRAAKKTINPIYGMKGTGFVKNPKKAVYNSVYKKTTVSAADVAGLNKKSTSASKTTSKSASTRSTTSPAKTKAQTVQSAQPAKVDSQGKKKIAVFLLLIIVIILLLCAQYFLSIVLILIGLGISISLLKK